MGARRGALRHGSARGAIDPGDEGGRAAAIRDHLVPLVRARGQRHRYGRVGGAGPLHLTTWESGALRCVLRVPFGPPGAQVPRPASEPGAALPYGLDVWSGGRVLSVAWDPGGPVEVVGFERGAWEDEALSLG